MKRFLLALFVSLIFCTMSIAATAAQTDPRLEVLLGLILVFIFGFVIYEMAKHKKYTDETKKNYPKEKKPKKKIHKPIQEAQIRASEPSGGGLTSKIARLQKLYKNGTLTKAEFEQAKNKLLK